MLQTVADSQRIFVMRCGSFLLGVLLGRSTALREPTPVLDFCLSLPLQWIVSYLLFGSAWTLTAALACFLVLYGILSLLISG